jgi:hypothetical protein
MRRGAILAVASAVTMGAAATAQEPLPLTGELQVNTFTTGNQDLPKAKMADDGVHVVIWRSQEQDGELGGIRFRKFPGDGSEPFVEGGLNQQTAGDQLRPGLGMNGDGDWVGVWESELSGQGIRARRTSGNGTALANEVGASQSTSSGTQNPAASRGADDAFVVVWERTAEVYFRSFAADGTPVTDDDLVDPGLAVTFIPDVASLAGGGFVVAYGSEDFDDGDVFAQRFDAGGLAVGARIPVPETSAGKERLAAVAALPDGGFVVAWDVPTAGVRWRRFAADGSPVGGEVAHGGGSNASQAAVAVAPGGGLVVAAFDGEVRAREYDRLGRPVSDLFQVNTTTSGLQSRPSVGVGDDRFVVAWQAQNLDGTDFGIARRLYRLRSVFADDFESGDTGGWSAFAP